MVRYVYEVRNFIKKNEYYQIYALLFVFKKFKSPSTLKEGWL